MTLYEMLEKLYRIPGHVQIKTVNIPVKVLEEELLKHAEYSANAPVKSIYPENWVELEHEVKVLSDNQKNITDASEKITNMIFEE